MRTVIELTAFSDAYKEVYAACDFDGYCGVTYEEAIHELAVDGGCASVWAICGLASVIERTIVSVYPSTINSHDSDDQLGLVLNRKMLPRRSYDNPLEEIYIMWTQTKPHTPGSIWTSNHYVPLVKGPDNVGTARSILSGSDLDLDQSMLPSLSNSLMPKDMLSDMESTRLPTSIADNGQQTVTLARPIPAPRTRARVVGEIAGDMGQGQVSDQVVCQESLVCLESAENAPLVDDLQLLEVHKGGIRLFHHGFTYVRDRSYNEKMLGLLSNIIVALI